MTVAACPERDNYLYKIQSELGKHSTASDREREERSPGRAPGEEGRLVSGLVLTGRRPQAKRVWPSRSGKIVKFIVENDTRYWV